MFNNNPIRLTAISFSNALVLRCNAVLYLDWERHRDV